MRSPNARVQIVIALVMVAITLVAGYFIIRRKPIQVELSAPNFVELHSGADKRALAPGGTVQAGEPLDFQLEVGNRCFVYLFAVEGGVARLEWGSEPNERAWEPGVYAPEWNQEGLRFTKAGSARLVAVASWVAQADAQSWSVATLDELDKKCPRCRKKSIELNVAAAAAAAP